MSAEAFLTLQQFAEELFGRALQSALNKAVDGERGTFRLPIDGSLVKAALAPWFVAADGAAIRAAIDASYEKSVSGPGFRDMIGPGPGKKLAPLEPLTCGCLL